MSDEHRDEHIDSSVSRPLHAHEGAKLHPRFLHENVASLTESELERKEECEFYVRQIAQALAKAWKQDDDLLEKFFFFPNSFPRWSKLSTSPTESSLCNRFRILLNDILRHVERLGLPSRPKRGPPNELKQRRAGDEKSLYVIKDAWIAHDLPGKESESSLLKLTDDKGVTMGIPEFQSSEGIRQGNDPDIILLNRKISSPSLEYLKLDRVHTRVVMKAYGKTINQFSSRKQLIMAFHDAVLVAPKRT
ncbi:hypothetical protein M422DRAFT_262212 [Sphaerobolus stellatus SS14]|uniref:Fungal-type protein kinase domain-containing protein n=1 Tax=Sphaerobolus stellatus (strain SS14) TaxID=990650 RepID=A0A0C9VDW4_SPHS4|nr:hypothetical protein M422DRAFT_262212 [Sphaerobolus stellatus SS14]